MAIAREETVSSASQGLLSDLFVFWSHVQILLLTYLLIYLSKNFYKPDANYYYYYYY